MTGRLEFEVGNRNVFVDLGYPRVEAESLFLRAQLMSEIRDAARGVTRAQAAKRFGVTQPRLNHLLRGRISKFSVDALVNMLATAGMRVEVRVKRCAARSEHPFADLEGVFGAVKLRPERSSLREKVRRRLRAKSGNRRRRTP